MVVVVLLYAKSLSVMRYWHWWACQQVVGIGDLCLKITMNFQEYTSVFSSSLPSVLCDLFGEKAKGSEAR